MPTVQAFTQEDREAARFAARSETGFQAAIRRTGVRALLTALIITAVMGTIVFVLWIGARQVQAGTLSMGELGAFLIYAALVAGGVGTLAEVWGDVMRASGATGRLLELLHAEPAIRDAETAAPSAQGLWEQLLWEQLSAAIFFKFEVRARFSTLSDYGSWRSDE